MKINFFICLRMTYPNFSNVEPYPEVRRKLFGVGRQRRARNG